MRAGERVIGARMGAKGRLAAGRRRSGSAVRAPVPAATRVEVALGALAVAHATWCGGAREDDVEQADRRVLLERVVLRAALG